MLNYKEFVNELKKQVAEKLGKGCRICMEKAGKVNLGLVDVLSVLDADSEGESMVPAFYPELLYKKYQSGTEIEIIAEETAEICQRSREDAGKAMQQTADIGDYGRMKGKLYYHLVHTERNREFLEGIPHFEVLDLSMVFYVLLSENDGGTGSVMVGSRLLGLWGITPEELREQAERNAPEILPVKTEAMSLIMQGILHSLPEAGDSQDMEGDFPWGNKTDEPYILTNTKMVNGFAAILYPGALKSMADRMGKDLYVLPSSRHEALLLPADSFMEPRELQDMVREVNAVAVAELDILSDSVYYYDRTKNELRIPGEEGKCLRL